MPHSTDMQWDNVNFLNQDTDDSPRTAGDSCLKISVASETIEDLIILENNEEQSTSPSESTCRELSFENCAEVNSDLKSDPSESNDDVKQDVPLSEALKQDVPLSEAVKQDVPLSKAVKQDVPLSEAVKQDVPLSEAAKQDVPLSEAVKQDVPLSEAAKQDVPLSEAAKQDVPLSEAAKQDVPLSEAAKQDMPLSKAMKQDVPLSEAVKQDVPLSEAAKQDVPLSKAAKQDVPMSEAVKQDVPMSEAVKQDVPVKKIFESRGRGNHCHKIRWSETFHVVLVLVLAVARPSAASGMIFSSNHGGYNVSTNRSTVFEGHLWRWPFFFFGVGVTPTAVSDEVLLWGCTLAVLVFMCLAKVVLRKCLAALCRRVILHLPLVGLNQRIQANRGQPQQQDEDFQSSFDPPDSVNAMPSNDKKKQESTLKKLEEMLERRYGDVTISQASLVNVNESILNKAGMSGKVGSGVVEQQPRPSAQEPTTSSSHPGTPLEFGASSGQDVKPFGLLVEHGGDEDIARAEDNIDLHEAPSADVAPDD